MNLWTTHKSGLILPERGIRPAYSDEDYERWINRRRAPFQPPFILPRKDAALTHSTLLSSFSATNSNTYTTAGMTWAAGDLIIASLAIWDSGATAGTITPTTVGLTWTQINTVVSSDRERCSTFRAVAATLGTAVTTLITITAGTSNSTCFWTFEAWQGYNTTTPVPQSNTNLTSGSGALTITLGALASASSAVMGNFANDNNNAGTPGSGYSLVTGGNQQNPTDGVTQTVIFKNPGTTTPSCSFAGAITCGVAIEIAAATGGGGFNPGWAYGATKTIGAAF